MSQPRPDPDDTPWSATPEDVVEQRADAHPSDEVDTGQDAPEAGAEQPIEDVLEQSRSVPDDGGYDERD